MTTVRLIKPIVLSLMVTLLLGISEAQATRQVTLAWDANPAAENVTGYLVYSGKTSRSAQGFTAYETGLDVGNVTQSTVNLTDDSAVYYLAVVAYNASGLRSDYSAEVSAAPPAPVTFTLTSSAGAGGSISPSGSSTVTQGGSQTYSVTPNTGYAVSSVTVDGSSVGAVGTYTFSNVTANHTIAATFAPLTYTVTASAGSGGSISPSGSASVTYGASKTYTLTPNTGYAVSSVTVDGSSVGAVGTYTFSNVTANHTISATFAPLTYSVTASAGSGGSISPSGSASVTYGGSKTYTVTPNTGYAVSSVMVDGSSVGAVGTYTFSNVTANHTISATFAPLTYTVTASAGAGGSISPSGSASVTYGASKTYTVTPNTGYAVSDVTVDGTSVGAVGTYTFSNVTANHTISATFAPLTYTVTVSAGSGGSISPSGSASVTYGASKTYTVTPNTGYAVSDVTVDGTSVGAVGTYTFSNVTANHTISATFAPLTYTVTASAGSGGSISPSGSASVTYGASKTYTVTPNTGYAVSDVTVDGTSVGAVGTYTFSNVTANHTIAATFSLIPVPPTVPQGLRVVVTIPPGS